MGVTRIATVRCDVLRLKELAAPHIVHAFTLHGVACKVVLFDLAVSRCGLLTA